MKQDVELLPLAPGTAALMRSFCFAAIGATPGDGVCAGVSDSRVAFDTLRGSVSGSVFCEIRFERPVRGGPGVATALADHCGMAFTGEHDPSCGTYLDAVDRAEAEAGAHCYRDAAADIGCRFGLGADDTRGAACKKEEGARVHSRPDRIIHSVLRLVFQSLS
ncbi:hypothetical protein U5A89_14975 [Sphingobium sp. HWE2-09]|uniref:hypothetical protein n=1 Tax=Sphingobium sp. HWE2-09 TaxID=3108390 RepID=UPI002DC95C4E|nr:hypothetical protein [Sphingobium sp. HWE2-09]